MLRMSPPLSLIMRRVEIQALRPINGFGDNQLIFLTKNLDQMYKFFIGCDMSKGWLDAAYYQNARPVYLGRFGNDSTGFENLIKALQNQTEVPCGKWFVCFENTGSYSKAFAHWLYEKGIQYKEENALKIHLSLGIKRGKSDQADAKDICKYAFEKRDSIECSEPDNEVIARLKKLIARRELLVRKKTALYVSLKEQKSLLDDDLHDLFESDNTQLTSLLNEQIIHIEMLITQTMKMDESIERNAKLAQTVIGIGPVITSYVIAFTDNFTKISNARKFCSYIGVAPFKHKQTGIFKGSDHVSHLANKRLKSLISNGTMAAKTHDPGLRLYFNKKLKEGKNKGSVLNAIKNKLMHRLFAVIRRQEPYVKLSYVWQIFISQIWIDVEILSHIFLSPCPAGRRAFLHQKCRQEALLTIFNVELKPACGPGRPVCRTLARRGVGRPPATKLLSPKGDRLSSA